MDLNQVTLPAQDLTPAVAFYRRLGLRLIVAPSPGGLRSPRWALLPLRLVVGFGFLAHGWAKWSRGPAGFAHLLAQIGVPLPQLTAWVVTLTEMLGGIAILAGVLVAIVSVPLIVSMLVALFTVQLRFGFSSVNTIGLTPDGPVFGPPGCEINLLYIGALVALAAAGPGSWSVDAWRRRRATESRPLVEDASRSACVATQSAGLP